MQNLISGYRSKLNPLWVAAQNPTALKLYGRVYGAPTTTLPTWNPVDVWPLAAPAVRVLPASTFTIGVSSASAQDTNTSGSGAWKVSINYLDSTYASQQSADILLTGQTMVNTGISALRINSVLVTAVGSGGSNAGIIYVFDQSSGVTSGVPTDLTKLYAVVQVGDNVSHQAMYTVPLGKQVAILQVLGELSSGAATAFNGRLAFSWAEWGGAALLPWKRVVIAGVSAASSDVWSVAIPDVLTERSEFRFQATGSAANSEIAVVAECLQYPYPTAGTVLP